MFSVDVSLEKLRNNEITFHTLLLDVKTNPDNLAIVLDLLRIYFNNNLQYSGKISSYNYYLDWILTIAGLKKELCAELVNCLTSERFEPPQEMLGAILEAIKENKNISAPTMAKSAMEMQILERDNFTGNALSFFKPATQEFFIDDSSKLKELYDKDKDDFYKPDYHPDNDEVKYIALAQIARDMEILVSDQEVASSCTIDDINLSEGLNAEENKRRALAALYTAKIDRKPAFLICSSGEHWAALGLIVEKDELYIFKFDSLNGSTMLDVSAQELGSLAKKALGLENINGTHDLSVHVQDHANCGIAVGGFIAEFTKFVRMGKSVDQIISEFKAEYQKDR